MTVEEGFRQFSHELVPVSLPMAAIKEHYSSIQETLQTNCQLTKLYRTGSVGHGTDLRDFSHVDYFAVLPVAKLETDSQTLFHQISQILKKRFPRTSISHQPPAITLSFGEQPTEAISIIPACYIQREGDLGVYDIPDGQGGWKQAHHRAHQDYLIDMNEKTNGHLKDFIRLVKAWKYYRSVPISSFYLELLATHYLCQEKQFMHSYDLKQYFKMMIDHNLAAIIDPLHISGYIHPCANRTDHEDVLSKAERAYGRCENARQAESKGDIEGAFFWWGMLYDGQFPSFYA